ncbi:MAG TPA: PadR family transcriptional regulator [Gemmatimonadaceae bacterium]|nr:PadR family transcriptional regulator [Gemmatimonadaceae bacterium]
MSRDDPRSHLPLTPIVLHILIALGDGERHGYAIAQEIEQEFYGVRVGPGTMYGSIQRMLAAKLIEEVHPKSRGDADSRRRYYRATALGKKVKHAELERLETLLQFAREGRTVRRPGLA